MDITFYIVKEDYSGNHNSYYDKICFISGSMSHVQHFLEGRTFFETRTEISEEFGVGMSEYVGHSNYKIEVHTFDESLYPNAE